MLSKMLLYKETTKGEVPTTPTCYAFEAEGFGINVTQKTESNLMIGTGRGANRKTYGNTEIAGDIPIIWDTDNAAIWCHHGIGEADTVADATAVDWVADTAYTAGDIVNHSNNTHTLACYVAGTSHATTEPDMSGKNRGDTIVDEGVTWIIMPTLMKFTGDRADCLDSFGIEIEDQDACEGVAATYTRYEGLQINSLPIAVSGDAIGVKSSLSCVGLDKADDLIDDSYTEMSDVAGFTEVTLVSDFYNIDDLTFTLNGGSSETVTTFDMTVNNNITTDDALNNKKVANTGQVNIEGNLNILFDSTIYAAAAAHTDQTAKLVFQKANGCKLEIEYPNFAMDKVDKVFETNKSTMLNIPISAFDTSTEKSITYEVITPLSSY